MSMVTSCPACTTTFRISQDQLKARHGKVRCGRCKDVFDAFKTLASLPDEPSAEVSAEASGLAAARSLENVAPVQSTLDIGPSDAIEHSRFAPLGEYARSPASPRKPYLLAAVWLLAAALALQVLYAVRVPLATAAPGLRPLFERVCGLTGCTIPLPRRTEELAIESSDLQADPARAGVIVLTAALRNRAATVVEYPALELTLTSAQEQPLARKIFTPRDYLQNPATAAAGMQPRAEVDVRIELDTGGLKAAGYRLFLFYP